MLNELFLSKMLFQFGTHNICTVIILSISLKRCEKLVRRMNDWLSQLLSFCSLSYNKLVVLLFVILNHIFELVAKVGTTMALRDTSFLIILWFFYTVLKNASSILFYCSIRVLAYSLLYWTYVTILFIILVMLEVIYEKFTDLVLDRLVLIKPLFDLIAALGNHLVGGQAAGVTMIVNMDYILLLVLVEPVWLLGLLKLE